MEPLHVFFRKVSLDLPFLQETIVSALSCLLQNADFRRWFLLLFSNMSSLSIFSLTTALSGADWGILSARDSTSSHQQQGLGLSGLNAGSHNSGCLLIGFLLKELLKQLGSFDLVEVGCRASNRG